MHKLFVAQAIRDVHSGFSGHAHAHVTNSRQEERINAGTIPIFVGSEGVSAIQVRKGAPKRADSCHFQSKPFTKSVSKSLQG